MAAMVLGTLMKLRYSTPGPVSYRDGWPSLGRQTTSVCNKPPRST